MTITAANDTVTFKDSAGAIREALVVKALLPGLVVKAAAASATTELKTGANGAAGDYLDHVTIIPTTTSPGAVQIKDGGGAAIDIFVGGASAIATLHSFDIPIGAVSQIGAWQIICGANVKAVAVGAFS